MPTPSGAASAYASLARLTQPGGAKSVGETAGGADSFGAMLKTAMNAVTEAGRNSDMQAQAMAAGKANVVDVVTAVAETETAIDAVVAVRDRVIAAYEEILRMPI
jgi:flagellar hook-basal body complex protein FliE